MAANTLNILKPSVNNLTVRIFVRAAGLDFEELDVWGKTTTPEYLAKYPAHLTPMLEEEGLPQGALGESCAIMQYLCNKHDLEQFYPKDPGRRAMIDNAMFYLIGTFYPLVTRATYPALGFGQYPGEVGTSDADDELKAKAQQDAEAALAEPLDVYRTFFLAGKRAMVDNAMFYLIGTFYPLLTRATYPALGFPQYPGEVATSDADDAMKEKAQQDAEAALAEPLEVYNSFFLAGQRFIGGDSPSIADFRFAATLEFLRAIDYDLPAWAEEYMSRMEETLGEAYSEPVADVRGYIDYVKSEAATTA